jgi:Spy/CpxP family protein refolding chaperone
MKISKRLYATTLALSATSMIGAPAVFADEDGAKCVDWKKLNLSSAQSQQIQTLEQDWNGKYMKMQPEILEHQRKLAKLLMDPKSDPLEIMSTNQRVAHLKEHLRNEATTNYLKKRAILNQDQQHQLETMMQQMIATRQQSAATVPQAEEQGGFMDIIHKVKWAIQQH